MIDTIIVNFSFGMGSYCAAKRMIAEYGVDAVSLLFADVKSEDEDTYKWGRAAAAALGCRLFEVSEGRTPWQLFEDTNFIGNSRVDTCSKILKRDLLDRWLRQFDERRTCLVFGIHWSEIDRFYKVDRKTGKELGIYPRSIAKGWKHVRAPMAEEPFVSIEEMERTVKADGLWTQRLYELGFPHANCGGECVKQGQRGWALLYKTMPERFLARVDWEEKMRVRLGDVAILKERRNGVTIPLPLIELQRRIDDGCSVNETEGGSGSCACFAGDDE